MAFASATSTSDASARAAGGVPAAALARRFADLRAADRRALVCYVTAGHPDPERSVTLLQALQEAGANVLEVGLPFSDPRGNVLYPGHLIDLGEQEGGVYRRTIIKTADPERYGIRVGDFYV